MQRLSPVKPTKSPKSNLPTGKGMDVSKVAVLDSINKNEIGDDEISTNVFPLIFDKIESNDFEM